MRFLPTSLARHRHDRHRNAQRQTRRQQFFRPRLETLEDRRLLAVDVFGVPEWTEIGPRGILPNGEAPHGVLSGAVQAIAPSPVNPNVVFVGTVNGGIWRTNDINASVGPTGGPVWTPLTDQFPAISISSLEFSPLDGKTLFAGTGKASSYRSMGNSLGILRGQSTGDADAPYAWSSHFQGLPPDAWIADVLPTSIGTDLNTQIVIAGSRGERGKGGLHISRDGGATWATETSIVPQATTATPGHVTDLMADPDQQQTGCFYFGMLPNQTSSAAAAGVWRGSWDDNGTPETTSDDSFRYERLLTSEILAGLGVNINFADLTNVKLASQRIAGTSYLYAGLVTGDWDQSGVPSNGRLKVIVVSTDGGAHWQTIGNQTDLVPKSS